MANHATPSSSKITLDHLPRRHRPRQSRRAPAPSAPTLAALATLLTSVGARPLETPPPFLCPFLDDDLCPLPIPTPAQRPPSSDPTPEPDSAGFQGYHHFHRTTNPSTLTSAAIIAQRTFTVPDKWEQGEDGLWRKTDEWALYGSSACGHCSTEVPIHKDDAVSASVTDTDTSATVVDAASLPKGWGSTHDSKHTSIILSISLALTILITSVIVGCVFWRRHRRRNRPKDEEHIKLRRLAQDSTAESSEELERLRATQKMWARATSRWRANVRSSARRRRSHRIQSTVKDSDLELPSHSSPEMQSLDSHSSRPPSIVSRASSASSNPPSLRSGSPVASRSSPERSTVRNSGPPAYIHRERDTYPGRDSGISPPPALNPAGPSNLDHLHYGHSWGAAHVATDDKHVLAEMARMRSAPQDGEISPVQFSTGVAVPEWRDEDYADFEDERHAIDPHSPRPLAGPSHNSLPLAFPSPPEKTRLAAPMFYDYPSSFEEDGAMVPSEPPTEGVPSAPSHDDCPSSVDVLAPSAPPLFDHEHGAPPSAAPSWEDVDDSADGHSWSSGSSSRSGSPVRTSQRRVRRAHGDPSLPTYQP